MALPAGTKARVTWTYEDYQLLPDDGRRYEILDGDLAVNPAPSTTHQTVSKRLQFDLMRELEKTGHALVFNAPVDVIFSETRVVQPDLVVLLAAHRNIVSERGIEGAPDLVIEILSPRTAAADRGPKRKLYASAGVPEYWLVDPARRRIEVLELAESEYVQAGDYGPGSTARSVGMPFSVAVDAVFE